MPDQHQFHLREELAEATRQGDDPLAPARAPQRPSNRLSDGVEEGTARPRAAEEAPRGPEGPAPENASVRVTPRTA